LISDFHPVMNVACFFLVIPRRRGITKWKT